MAIKINKTQKSNFISRLQKKVFDPQFDENQAKIDKATLDIYNVVFPEELQKALSALPPACVKKSEWLTISIARREPIQATKLPCAMPMPVGNAAFVSSHYSEDRWRFASLNPSDDSYQHPHFKGIDIKALTKKLEALSKLIEAEDQIVESRSGFVTKLEAALSNIQTAEKLKLIYPDLAAEWEELMGPFSKSAGLPAVIIDDCLDLIRKSAAKKVAA